MGQVRKGNTLNTFVWFLTGTGKNHTKVLSVFPFLNGTGKNHRKVLSVLPFLNGDR